MGHGRGGKPEFEQQEGNQLGSGQEAASAATLSDRQRIAKLRAEIQQITGAVGTQDLVAEKRGDQQHPGKHQRS